MDQRLDELHINIFVGFKVIPKPWRRAFGGTGVKRRREDIGALEIASRLAKKISYLHGFYEDGRRVDLDDLTDFLFEHLKAVPDATAKALTSVDASGSEAALKAITSALVDALVAQWEIRYEPGQPPLPGQGVKWGP